MDILQMTQIIGYGLTAFGQYQGNKAQASIATANAQRAETEANMSRVAADFNIAAIERQKESFRASQRMGYAKGGVRLEGSPIDVIANTAAEFEMDKIAERYQTDINIYRKQSEASESRARAGIYTQAGLLEPALTLLKAAPTIYQSSSVLKKKG